MSTEAGTRLLELMEHERRMDTESGAWRGGVADAEIMVRDALPAIEQEAVTAERARIRAAISTDRVVLRHDDLCLLEGPVGQCTCGLFADLFAIVDAR